MKRKIEIDGITYMVWFGVTLGTDLTEFIEYVKPKIQQGIMSGFYPHWEAKKLSTDLAV